MCSAYLRESFSLYRVSSTLSSSSIPRSVMQNDPIATYHGVKLFSKHCNREERNREQQVYCQHHDATSVAAAGDLGRTWVQKHPRRNNKAASNPGLLHPRKRGVRLQLLQVVTPSIPNVSIGLIKVIYLQHTRQTSLYKGIHRPRILARGFAAAPWASLATHTFTHFRSCNLNNQFLPKLEPYK